MMIKAFFSLFTSEKVIRQPQKATQPKSRLGPSKSYWSTIFFICLFLWLLPSASSYSCTCLSGPFQIVTSDAGVVLRRCPPGNCGNYCTSQHIDAYIGGISSCNDVCIECVSNCLTCGSTSSCLTC